MITSTYALHAETFPYKAAICTKEETIYYPQWSELVARTASWFHNLHNQKKIVAIYLPNGIPFLQIFTGASAAGWTAVPLDLKWKDSELSKKLDLASPSFLITTRSLYDKVNPLFPNVIVWEDCIEEIEQSLCLERISEDTNLPFYMGFTSGSTGEPKAFIRSHASWVASFACTSLDLEIQENDHVLIPGSLLSSHFLYGVISTLFLGGTVHLLEKFSSSETLSNLQTSPISVIYLVPTMAEAILKEDVVINRPFKIISSGAKWESSSKKRMHHMFPYASLYEFYGASELSFVAFSNDEEKQHSVGRPFHNVEIQIRKNNLEEAVSGEIGKIYVRSPCVFMGYLNVFGQLHSMQDEQGWVTVDDMGYLDDEGFLYIVGRENNMIIYGGLNIFPEEIESVLYLHPEVEEAAVIGQKDSYWGETVTAVVKGKASKQELKHWCKDYLTSYKIPRRWYFIEEMPLTTSGKIARAQLKEQLERMKILT